MYLPISKAINICKASKFPKTSDDSVTCSKGAVDDAQAQIIQITGPRVGIWMRFEKLFDAEIMCIFIYLHSVYYMYILCVYDIDIDIYYNIYIL